MRANEADRRYHIENLEHARGRVHAADRALERAVAYARQAGGLTQDDIVKAARMSPKRVQRILKDAADSRAEREADTKWMLTGNGDPLATRREH